MTPEEIAATFANAVADARARGFDLDEIAASFRGYACAAIVGGYTEVQAVLLAKRMCLAEREAFGPMTREEDR